jgi:hypothetical protein
MAGQTRKMKMRCNNLALIGCASLFMAFSGCGKVPTWGELTGQSKPVAANQPVTQVNQTPPKPPELPPEPSPEEIIAKFSALGPGQKTDQLFLQLTSLKSGLDSITEINADGSLLTREAMINIDRLTGLKQLRLNRTKMDDVACQKIALLSSLEVLALSETQITDVGAAALSGLQNLKHLELSKCILTENGFRAIGNLPSLKTILVEATNMDNRDLELLCNARTLTELTLASNPINDFGLASLSKLEPLEFLEISQTSITGEGLIKAMKGGGLKQLRHLGLYACPINDRGAKAISTIKSVEHLNIGLIPLMNDVGLDNIIKGMKGLKYINLSGSPTIDGSGLRSLKNSKEMEILLIDGCPRIGDPLIQILKTIKSLKRVALGGTAVTPRGREELQSALPDVVLN